jgi:hypothetical protein
MPTASAWLPTAPWLRAPLTVQTELDIVTLTVSAFRQPQVKSPQARPTVPAAPVTVMSTVSAFRRPQVKSLQAPRTALPPRVSRDTHTSTDNVFRPPQVRSLRAPRTVLQPPQDLHLSPELELLATESEWVTAPLATDSTCGTVKWDNATATTVADIHWSPWPPANKRIANKKS